MTERIVSKEDWLKERKDLLQKEKEFNKSRDALSTTRRQLPWVRVEKDYAFEGNNGRVSLADLFEGKGQLVIYHFMYGPDWEEGCQSCSFWADTFNGIDVHLAHRDISFKVISRASLDQLNAFKKRMGWNFDWYSSGGSDFNFDYGVSFREDGEKIVYNYHEQDYFMDELVGVSVFAKASDGTVCHTYSTYSRGVDILNAAYNYIDLTPKGRDEDGLKFTQAWVRHHDKYGD